MKFTAPKCAFKLSGNKVVTDGSVMNKITGTSLGAVLGVSPFVSPFRAACALLGVGREDIDGKQSVEIGRYLEDKLIGYCAERYADYGAFIPAEQVFAKREGDHDSWASDWEDDLFSGHLDGVVAADDGNHVLEVKTSGNMDSWANGVPEYYKLQVELYNHFMYKAAYAYVILGIVTDETRKDVTTWAPKDEDIMLFKLDMDEEQFVETLNKATAWYDQYIRKGITPEYDPTDPKDVEMWNHLAAIAAPDTEIQADLNRLEALTGELETLSQAIDPIKEEIEEVQKKIKDYMIHTNKMELATSSKRMVAVLTHSERSRIDKKLLVAAGIDPTPYTITTKVDSFSFKMAKETD